MAELEADSPAFFEAETASGAVRATQALEAIWEKRGRRR